MKTTLAQQRAIIAAKKIGGSSQSPKLRLLNPPSNEGNDSDRDGDRNNPMMRLKTSHDEDVALSSQASFDELQNRTNRRKI